MDNPIQFIRVTGLKSSASTSITHSFSRMQVRGLAPANLPSSATLADGASTVARAAIGGTLQVLQLKLNPR